MDCTFYIFLTPVYFLSMSYPLIVNFQILLQILFLILLSSPFPLFPIIILPLYIIKMIYFVIKEWSIFHIIQWNLFLLFLIKFHLNRIFCVLYVQWLGNRDYPSKNVIHSTSPFQLVHIDMLGPYHTPTYNGFKYFLTLVDNFSRVTWTHLFSYNCGALFILKAFTSMVKTQLHSSGQCLRSNNAYELGFFFESKTFFVSQGILH